MIQQKENNKLDAKEENINGFKTLNKRKILKLGLIFNLCLVFLLIITELVKITSLDYLKTDLLDSRIGSELNMKNSFSEGINLKNKKSILKRTVKREETLDDSFVNYRCIPNGTECEDRRETLIKVLSSRAFNRKIRPIYIEFHDKVLEPRAFAVGHEVTLSAGVPEAEQVKLLVHELGHVIDVFFLRRRNGEDISDLFYDISWESETEKKEDSRVEDFISGYGMSNYYEDFGESLTFYIFHNEEFVKRYNSNEKLKLKYDFIKERIFKNSEFIGTNFSDEEIPDYIWDTTKLKIDLKKFVNMIE